MNSQEAHGFKICEGEVTGHQLVSPICVRYVCFIIICRGITDMKIGYTENYLNKYSILFNKINYYSCNRNTEDFLFESGRKGSC